MSKHAITLVEVADRAGVVPEEMHLIHGPFTRDGGYASAQALLSDGPRVTCLFAVNDVMAVGAMAALRNTATISFTGHNGHPKSVTAGTPPEATLRDRSRPLAGAPHGYKPSIRSEQPEQHRVSRRNGGQGT